MTTSSDGKTLEKDPIYFVQGHLIYEFFPALWAALDATYYVGGRTTIDGEKRGEHQENVRLGVIAALSMSRHRRDRLAIPLGWRAVASAPFSCWPCDHNALTFDPEAD